MSPLCRQPGVIEVQPADHGANIEGCLHRVEQVASSGHPGSLGNYGARNDRPEKLAAGRILQGLQGATQGVDQAVAGCLVSLP